jgi:glycosyltransferase involved in cell wall biosynthesis
MIVRNEAHILTRCLDSVRPYIDHAVICDTGSTDDTCVMAKSYLKAAGIPGKVLHQPWQDFGHNRTLALQAAAGTGCEWTLVIDADETLVVENPDVLEGLQNDAYRIEMRFPGVSYPRLNLVRSARDFRYVGVIHEYATADPHPAEYMLDPAKIHMWTDGQGARGKSPDKSQRDCKVLEHAVLDEPQNPRYWFYLAQTYETVGRAGDALKAYAQRAGMGDYKAEVWFSLYRMAQLHAHLNQWPEAQRYYLMAYEHSPHRAEPLYWLAIGHHNRQQDNTALLYLEQATVIDEPIGDLFVENAVYKSSRWMQYAICLHNVGKQAEAEEIAVMALADNRVPPEHREVLAAIAGQVKTAVEATA